MKLQNESVGTSRERVFDAWASSEREISCMFRCQPKQRWSSLTAYEWTDGWFAVFCRRGRIRATGTKTRAAAAITIPSTSVTSGTRSRAAQKLTYCSTRHITSVWRDISHALLSVIYSLCLLSPKFIHSKLTLTLFQARSTDSCSCRFLDHFDLIWKK